MKTVYLRLLATLTLPLYLLDQATKWATVWKFDHEHQAIEVIPGFFDLGRWHNTGAAFSIMSDSNRFFIGLSLAATVVLAVLAWKNLFSDRVSRVAWALLLAGVLGNLTDRIVHGYVVDFLSFDLHIPGANPWPAFNVADICICTAAGLFVLQSFREGR